MSYCSNCGDPLPEDAHFCTSCGHNVEGVAKQTAPQQNPVPVQSQPVQRPALPAAQPPAPAEKKSKSGCKIAAIVVGTLFVLAVTGIGAVFMLLNSVTKPIVELTDEYFTAIRSSQIEKAYSMTSPAFRAITSPEDFANFVNQNPALQTVTGSSFLSRSVEGNQGEIIGELETSSGQPIPIEIKFSKDASGWKIEAIHFPGTG